jgi:hypothetical protein
MKKYTKNIIKNIYIKKKKIYKKKKKEKRKKDNVAYVIIMITL